MTRAIVLAALLALAGQAGHAQEDTTQAVALGPNGTARVESAIEGFQLRRYLIGAPTGATLTLDLATDLDAAFDVVAPGSDETMWNGEMAGDRRFSDVLAIPGDYMVIVRLIGADADSGASGTFALSVAVAP